MIGRMGLAAALLGAAACAPAEQEPRPAVETASAPAALPAVDTLAPDLVVRRIADGVWIHTSVRNDIPSNGLLIERADGSILIDTAWGEEPTGRLAAWARDVLRKPVRRVVSTHFHDDRTEGVDTLRALGASAGALDLTRELALAAGNEVPDALFTAQDGVLRDPDGFEVFYPGPGHSRDNVVVWLPREEILVGGCMVKAAAASDLGNVADADLARWPASVDAVRRRYPAARVVVPGHGPEGGRELLAHTLALLARDAPKPGGGR